MVSGSCSTAGNCAHTASGVNDTARTVLLETESMVSVSGLTEGRANPASADETPAAGVSPRQPEPARDRCAARGKSRANIQVVTGC